SRLPSMAPSSPASRPRPPGGLRPALTPAAGDATPAGTGTRPREGSNKFTSLRIQGIATRQGAGRGGDCAACPRRVGERTGQLARVIGPANVRALRDADLRLGHWRVWYSSCPAPALPSPQCGRI